METSGRAIPPAPISSPPQLPPVSTPPARSPMRGMAAWRDWPRRVMVGEGCVGKGVFAARGFRKGQVIGIVEGELIDDPDYTSTYCMYLGSENVSLEPGEPFRYMNHSCLPNAELVYDDSPDAFGQPQYLMFVIATSSIRQGDEIYIDYAWPADSAIPCHCGSHICRGWVVDPDEIHLLPLDELND